MLFGSAEQIREYVGQWGINSAWTTISPSVEVATRKYLVPAIGPGFYEALLNYLTAQNGEVGDAAGFMWPAVQKLRAALAPYVALEFSKVSVVDLGNAGTVESSPDKTNSVRQWTLRDFQKAMAENGDSALEEALRYLEENADQFVEFRDSEAYTVAMGCLVPSLTALRKHVTEVAESRKLFLKMRPHLMDADSFDISQLVGEEQVNALLDAQKANTLAGVAKTLFAKLQPISALRGLARALVGLNLTVEDGGIRLFSTADGIDKKDPAPETALSGFKLSLLARAGEHEGTLKAWLAVNGAELSEYYAWASGKTSTAGYIRPDNCTGNGIIMM